MLYSEPQIEFMQSDAKETFFCGGVGSGKSFALGTLAYEAAKLVAGSVTLLAAPTMDTLRNSTLKQVEGECWNDKFGLREGIHYVINEMPPPSWGVKPYSELSNTRVITWRNGSYTILDSLENYQKHRGSAYDRILIDEFQSINPDVRKVLLARLRGKIFKAAGLTPRLYYAFTPPDKPEYMRYLLQLHNEWNEGKAKDMHFLFGTSYDNQHNLPEDYLETLASNWDDKTLQREVYAQLVMDTAGLYTYAFDEDKHLKGVSMDEDLPIYLCMDFNIGVMATTVWQFRDGEFCYCVDEFEPESRIDIIQRCQRIKERYGNLLYGAIVTGDPATGATGLKKNMNYYTVIQSELDLQDWQFKVRKHHPDSRDAAVLVNSMFSRFPDIAIHPKCGNLIHDIKFCTTTDDGKLDKSDKRLTHYLDTMIYFFDYHFKSWYLKK